MESRTKITCSFSNDPKKSLQQNSTFFKNKSTEKLGVEGMYLNIIKVICNKHIANIIPNGEKLKPFPLKIGTRYGCPLTLT
jgi:hypothetical protein